MYKYDPNELINLGLFQLELFEYVLQSKNIPIIIAAHFNLHLALELILKGYLAHLDSSYENESKLISLRHNITLIAKKIGKFEPEREKEINNLVIEYHFLQKQADSLRYFRKGDTIFVQNSYTKLSSFIRDLQKEIRK